jgi:sarcosine oxidase subunit beta
VKKTAEVVIIGGGIQGTSAAYHLAKRGITDIVLVEMDLVGSGSSGKSAAMLSNTMSRRETIRLSQESFKEYLNFSEELGVQAGFRQMGHLTVATPAVEPKLREEVTAQLGLGVPVEILEPAQIKEVVPVLNVEDLALGAVCWTDGIIDPHAVMQAYTRRARALGAEIDERVQATGIEVQGGQVTSVRTSQGLISTGCVVNAAGARAIEVADWIGLKLPIRNYKRHIFVTDEFQEISSHTPIVMDLQDDWYFRKEGAGILIGMGSEESLSYEPSVEWELQELLVERAMHRAPVLANARIIRGWVGLRAITPDDLPVIGLAPNTKGFVNCCGWGGHGVMHAPIGGLLTAETIIDGHATTLDISPFCYERFAKN